MGIIAILSNLDITNKIMLKEVLDATKPDLIINLAAMTNVDLV